ncbi:hypothetical protein PRZ48_015099 [Zasmidium cellare]|uniref:NAD(P)-binding domain-containing protein n=1 Tax=Zasmidium cellare TaxID=395010 RepID=A0ABR0DY56_ZASCE|nr:hypothetical protein PRZ48_015099 [Zasmidium cellare]
MHLLVLGATGPSGIAFVTEALKAGHKLTIYARNPSKLPQEVSSNSNVQTIKGTFDDMDAAREATRTGATVLVSFAGPAVPNNGTPVTEFYEKLFPMILSDPQTKIKRCLCCTTPSYKIPDDKPSWKWWFCVLAIWLIGGSAYDEVNGIGRVVSALPLSEIEWTLFRVPALTNGEAKPVRAGNVGEGKDGIILSRKSIAIWVLQELQEKKWVGKAPALCNPGWI